MASQCASVRKNGEPPEPDEATRRALDAVSDPELKQILAGARVMLGRR